MTRSTSAAVPVASAVLLAALFGCEVPRPGSQGPEPAKKPSAPVGASVAAGEPSAPSGATGPRARSPVELPQETRLRNVRRLTDGGENAEAYWSWDGKRLVFQARREGRECDEMRVMTSDGAADHPLASKGANTCGFFLRDDGRILFSSTRASGDACPLPPDRSRGYVWAVRPDFDIYTALPDGSDVRALVKSPGYDAEATVGPDGRIVFTSARDGDLDLYVMDADGSDVKRLTDTPGYDGGAFFSPDGARIVYRASRPTGAELDEYRSLLAEGLVRPSRLEIHVMNADGSGVVQVTALGKAAFAPTFTPDGSRILFASNHEDPQGRDFDLFLVGIDGRGLERVTFNDSFDGFPMFSPDGRRLAFCSNRAHAKEGETNVFVADWIEP